MDTGDYVDGEVNESDVESVAAVDSSMDSPAAAKTPASSSAASGATASQGKRGRKTDAEKFAEMQEQIASLTKALKQKDTDIEKLRSESVAPVVAAGGSNSGSSSGRTKRNASQSAEDADTGAAVASTKGAPIKPATHIKLLKERIDNNKDAARLFDPSILFWLFTFILTFFQIPPQNKSKNQEHDRYRERVFEGWRQGKFYGFSSRNCSTDRLSIQSTEQPKGFYS